MQSQFHDTEEKLRGIGASQQVFERHQRFVEEQSLKLENLQTVLAALLAHLREDPSSPLASLQSLLSLLRQERANRPIPLSPLPHKLPLKQPKTRAMTKTSDMPGHSNEPIQLASLLEITDLLSQAVVGAISPPATEDLSEDGGMWCSRSRSGSSLNGWTFIP
ncbi:MAG: hypothetical protein HY731_01305 [Candidatus Tectomicrobia bacterium]|nr:hypothetical protein [Candidatus Tectomicrobia bacterium]